MAPRRPSKEEYMGAGGRLDASFLQTPNLLTGAMERV